MTEEFFTEQLPNGMTLLGQRMEQVASTALVFLVPGGASHDPTGAGGAGAIACEWSLRGAGDLNTRQLNDALDSLGAQHHETPESEHLRFSATQLGRNLPEVLEIYAEIIRRPSLEDTTFDPSRSLILQDLASLEDEPANKCNVLLREKFYPMPLGRCVYGDVESLQRMKPDEVRRHVRKQLNPHGTILAVAGNIDWERIRNLAHEHFGDWTAQTSEQVTTQQSISGSTHVGKDSHQVHIGIAHKSVPLKDHRYYAARLAEAVLSWGMGCRLFTEVREKRGLVYHVSSSYHTLKDHAGMFTYAGTRPEVAQQTLEVTVGELRRLAEGIEPTELKRAKTQLKSALVLQGESSAARANALASDFYHLRRLRTLEEISDAIESVTVEQVVSYLKGCPAADLTILVIGPEPLDTATVQEQ